MGDQQLTSTLEEVTRVGPWGESRGDSWSFRPVGRITEVAYSFADESRSWGPLTYLQFKSEFGEVSGIVNTALPPSETNIDIKVYKFKDDEYLTGIRGTVNKYNTHGGAEFIASLGFRTKNRKEYVDYGRYGWPAGSEFYYDSAGDVVVGFYGHSDISGKYVTGIGCYVKQNLFSPDPNKPPSSNLCTVIGPWGDDQASGNADTWSYMPKGAITQIQIQRGGPLFYLKFKSEHGETSNIGDFFPSYLVDYQEPVKMNIRSPAEYLIGVSGTYAKLGSANVITKLTFVTNLRSLGPYGYTDPGMSFSYTVPDGCSIVGFHGRAGRSIHSIGVYVKSTQAPTPVPKPDPSSSETQHIFVRPWGGPRGKHWRFEADGAIKKIVVGFGAAVEFIKFKKGDDDQLLTFGCKLETNDTGFETIDLSDPGEHLKGISGTIGELGSEVVVKSLAFQTNIDEYGPYGSEDGTPFSMLMEGGVIVGFHGRESKTHLTAIGVYLKPYK